MIFIVVSAQYLLNATVCISIRSFVLQVLICIHKFASFVFLVSLLFSRTVIICVPSYILLSSNHHLSYKLHLLTVIFIPSCFLLQSPVFPAIST